MPMSSPYPVLHAELDVDGVLLTVENEQLDPRTRSVILRREVVTQRPAEEVDVVSTQGEPLDDVGEDEPDGQMRDGQVFASGASARRGLRQKVDALQVPLLIVNAPAGAPYTSRNPGAGAFMWAL